jgi:hypothetical protein
MSNNGIKSFDRFCLFWVSGNRDPMSRCLDPNGFLQHLDGDDWFYIRLQLKEWNVFSTETLTLGEGVGLTSFIPRRAPSSRIRRHPWHRAPERSFAMAAVPDPPSSLMSGSGKMSVVAAVGCAHRHHLPPWLGGCRCRSIEKGPWAT